LEGQETNSFDVPLSLGLQKAFIEEKRKNQNKAPVQLSSNCYYMDESKTSTVPGSNINSKTSVI